MHTGGTSLSPGWKTGKALARVALARVCVDAGDACAVVVSSSTRFDAAEAGSALTDDSASLRHAAGAGGRAPRGHLGGGKATKLIEKTTFVLGERP